MIWLSCGRVSLEFLERLSLGPPLLEVHSSPARNECMRSPIFIPSSVAIPVAHAYVNTHPHTHTHTHGHTGILLNGRALPLSQSMEYHICLFFWLWNFFEKNSSWTRVTTSSSLTGQKCNRWWFHWVEMTWLTLSQSFHDVTVLNVSWAPAGVVG